jgi:hypothetical protein
MNIRLSNRLEGDRELPKQMGYGAWIVHVDASAVVVIVLAITILIMGIALARRTFKA